MGKTGLRWPPYPLQAHQWLVVKRQLVEQVAALLMKNFWSSPGGWFSWGRLHAGAGSSPSLPSQVPLTNTASSQPRPLRGPGGCLLEHPCSPENQDLWPWLRRGPSSPTVTLSTECWPKHLPGGQRSDHKAREGFSVPSFASVDFQLLAHLKQLI